MSWRRLEDMSWRRLEDMSSRRLQDQQMFAGKEFRSYRLDTEWMLQSKFLNLELEHLYFKPEIDLFAANINTQFNNSSSFEPDPEAMYKMHSVLTGLI